MEEHREALALGKSSQLASQLASARRVCPERR
jgi:hypothetical protein